MLLLLVVQDNKGFAFLYGDPFVHNKCETTRLPPWTRFWQSDPLHGENRRLRVLITSLRKKSKHQNTQHMIDRNLWWKLWKWELDKHTKECLLIWKKALNTLQCEYDDVQKLLNTCPITHDPMKDPVICIRDGHRYEREPITEWTKQNGKSPMTRKAVSLGDLIPDSPGAILKAIASKEVCE